MNNYQTYLDHLGDIAGALDDIALECREPLNELPARQYDAIAKPLLRHLGVIRNAQDALAKLVVADSVTVDTAASVFAAEVDRHVGLPDGPCRVPDRIAEALIGEGEVTSWVADTDVTIQLDGRLLHLEREFPRNKNQWLVTPIAQPPAPDDRSYTLYRTDGEPIAFDVAPGALEPLPEGRLRYDGKLWRVQGAVPHGKIMFLYVFEVA